MIEVVERKHWTEYVGYSISKSEKKNESGTTNITSVYFLYKVVSNVTE